MRDRKITTPWDPEVFGCEAHGNWYRDVGRAGLHDAYTMDSADSWWRHHVRVGSGYQAYGMRYPASQSEVAEAYAVFDALTREALRDRAREEYDEPEYVGRVAGRWESVDE